MSHYLRIDSQLAGWLACGGLMFCQAGAPPDVPAAINTNPPPHILRRLPPSFFNIAGVGEEFGFSVEAEGAGPLRYQWQLNGANLPRQTNSSLLLTNLSGANSGYYTVIVGDANGRTNASTLLEVRSSAHRRLFNGRVLQEGSQVAIPIILRAGGFENAVAFSVKFDPGVYSGPVFIPTDPNAGVTLNADEVGNDVVGVTVQLPGPLTFMEGYPVVGLLQFTLAGGASPLDGRLLFTTNPVPIAAFTPRGTSLAVSASIQPQYEPVTSRPELNVQSGLFEQTLILGNPGAAKMANVDIIAARLGYDSLGNLISFHNAQGRLTSCPFNDCELPYQCADESSCNFTNYLTCHQDCSFEYTGTITTFPFAQVNGLEPGESRPVTLEFDVLDHRTVPRPSYDVFQAKSRLVSYTPAGATPVGVIATRYIDGTFVVEFQTQAGLRYYVQYADTPQGLTDPSQMKTSWPPVRGSGSRVQWIDNGPPRTVSPPVNGGRFYRVRQSPY